jgi:hypothetical protein
MSAVVVLVGILQVSKECTADYKKKVSYFTARTVKNCHECEKAQWLFSPIGKGDE